jgi:hypothetical protein
MIEFDFVALSREQFTLLREAKREVKKEFGEDLILADDNVLKSLYAYALESKGETLFTIYDELRSGIEKQEFARKKRTQVVNIVKEGDHSRSENKVSQAIKAKLPKSETASTKKKVYYRGALIDA